MRGMILLVSLIFLCEVLHATENKFSSKDYVLALKKVTDVMVDDATSPVAASRYYAYVTIAANQVEEVMNPSPSGINHLLNQFPAIEFHKESTSDADVSFAVVYIVFRMGEKLLPSGYLLQSQTDSLLKVAERKLSKEQIVHSKALSDEIADQILKYAKQDRFNTLSILPKYTPSTEEGTWQPTPPVFMQPVEPYWNRLRPFLCDSAAEFKPVVPAKYNTADTSAFYKLSYEVYNTVNHLSKEQQAIAQFWDCNPFAVQQLGHVEFAIKKISPGGHWINITGIACLKKKLTLAETAKVHAMLAVTLADAFISCWDEKYRSNRIRPETVITGLIDNRWKPLLQTPPFPEYPSGHSVISTAAATILTQIFGDKFSFEDDSEVEFGLPVRRFTSFLDASREAAISRLYGGIHFRDAIEQGIVQGSNMGKMIGDKIKPAMALAYR